MLLNKTQTLQLYIFLIIKLVFLFSINVLSISLTIYNNIVFTEKLLIKALSGCVMTS